MALQKALDNKRMNILEAMIKKIADEKGVDLSDLEKELDTVRCNSKE